MSFFERARSGYEQLAGRADEMMDRTGPQQVGDVDRIYRDLGMLAYLAASGRPHDESVRGELLSVLRAMEERGAVRDFLLSDGRPAGGTGVAPPLPRPAGSDGVATPPPERAGRHGSFLTQSRTPPPPPPTPAAGSRTRGSEPDEDTSPPSTWGV